MKNNKTIIYCALLSFIIHIGIIYSFNDGIIVKNVKSIKALPNLKVSLEDIKSENLKSISTKVSRREVARKNLKKEDVTKITDKGTSRKKESNLEADGDIILAKPDYKHAPRPKYPVLAKKFGYEGLVNLKVKVLESGIPNKVLVLSSSGYEILDKAARDAVVKWKFFPASKNGKSFACWINIPIRFELE